MDKQIVETEATIVEIDGEMWAIVLLAPNYGSPEVKTLVSNEVWRKLERHDHLVTGIRRSDGTIGFAVSPEFQQKLHKIIPANHKWKKVRLYPPTDTQ